MHLRIAPDPVLITGVSGAMVFPRLPEILDHRNQDEIREHAARHTSRQCAADVYPHENSARFLRNGTAFNAVRNLLRNSFTAERRHGRLCEADRDRLKMVSRDLPREGAARAGRFRSGGLRLVDVPL